MGTLRHETGELVVLSPEHVVGRMSSCSLILDASFVSTAHALIRWTGRSWEVRDLGSKNGTFVNGYRLAGGSAAKLSQGATVAFGRPSEAWQLIEATPPTVMAVPVEGGQPRYATSGVIAVPTRDKPEAMIYFTGNHWLLELADEKRALKPGERFYAAGRQWRFESPAGLAAPTASNEEPWDLESVILAFMVSRNHEHVRLKVRKGERVRDLGHRSCFYLGLILARHRLDDRTQPGDQSGWVDNEALLKMMPEYTGDSHLNVDIYRLRKLLHDAGLFDAPRIIERRRGQVRLGTDRVELDA
jgi:hypothetical protein